MKEVIDAAIKLEAAIQRFQDAQYDLAAMVSALDDDGEKCPQDLALKNAMFLLNNLHRVIGRSAASEAQRLALADNDREKK